MKLVVAEKPSVAQSLAAVLGANQKKQGYLQGNDWLVSWCVGHLVGLLPMPTTQSILNGRMRIYRLSRNSGNLRFPPIKKNNSKCFLA